MNKIIMLIYITVGANAGAATMTLAQAKQKIAEISAKQTKTADDITEFKQALKIVSGSWARAN